MSIVISSLTMDQEILEKIEKNTTAKPSFQIVLAGVGSKLETEFISLIDFEIECKYKIALASLETQITSY